MPDHGRQCSSTPTLCQVIVHLKQGKEYEFMSKQKHAVRLVPPPYAPPASRPFDDIGPTSHQGKLNIHGLIIRSLRVEFVYFAEKFSSPCEPTVRAIAICADLHKHKVRTNESRHSTPIQHTLTSPNLTYHFRYRSQATSSAFCSVYFYVTRQYVTWK